jgi:hypothetical protein
MLSGGINMLKNNEDGSITIRCSHFIHSRSGFVNCTSMYPCHKLKIIVSNNLTKTINYWCGEGIIKFDWLDVLIIGPKKIERMANIRLGSKKESIV